MRQWLHDCFLLGFSSSGHQGTEEVGLLRRHTLLINRSQHKILLALWSTTSSRTDCPYRFPLMMKPTQKRHPLASAPVLERPVVSGRHIANTTDPVSKSSPSYILSTLIDLCAMLEQRWAELRKLNGEIERLLDFDSFVKDLQEAKEY